MKIVSTKLRERYDGILESFAEFFDSVILWEPNIRPITDVIDVCNPDFIFCDVKYVDNFFIKICNEYNKAKVVLFSEMVPRELKPYLICSEPNISPLLKKHLELNNNITYIYDFANIFLFKRRKGGRLLESDISYYSNHNIHSVPEEKLKIFTSITNNDTFNFKIAGPSILSLPNYIGNIEPVNVVNFWEGSKIAIDWHNKNLLDLAANRIFTLSTHPNKLFPLLKEGNELNEQLSSFIENSKARRKIAKKAQGYVLSCDTVYHRVLQIAEKMEVKEEIIENIKNKIVEINKCEEE